MAVDLPEGELLLRVLLLRDYNTRLVVLSTATLGLAAGLVGSFLLLRKRSLMGDALSHATLPGIALAFLVMVAFGGGGKATVGLLLGAVVTGVLGVLAVLAIRNTTRIKDDAAMGIVLSVFFGVGVALMGVAQSVPTASGAGLSSFIYGKTASMVRADALLIGSVAVACVAASLLLLKEFTLLCFDEAFAESEGYPTLGLDIVMLGLVAAVTVAGLQAVGLILIIALLITPAAAARFWTSDLRRMLVLSGLIGAGSGWLGATLSALLPGLPAGAVIVLVVAGVFVVSMLLGPPRGVMMRLVRQARLRRKVGRQHLLRAVYELLEQRQPDAPPRPVANARVPMDELRGRRSWSAGRLRRLIRRARAEDHLDVVNRRWLRLSEPGFGEAARITRNHRLWEMYLIRHADLAPAHVDRDADAVEHVLDPALVRQLERDLDEQRWDVPASPHELGAPVVAEGGGSGDSGGSGGGSGTEAALPGGAAA
jgi:manganese/zinc/iron transport system permease protein